eukprot:GHVS01073659.1.p1 GENE.GHVS01073659.1~~GHVS01073659.1.p1  ORF type:complete len:280 (+),score=29.92 GHVS01073659.1:239-1078(+)
MSLLIRSMARWAAVICWCSLPHMLESAPVVVPRRFAELKSVVRMWHDKSCFTQGLEFVNSTTVVESCGLYGKSRVQLVDLTAESVTTRTAVSPFLFLEGLTVVGDKVFVLTWKEHKVLEFTLPHLRHVNTYQFPYDGWGFASHRKTGDATDIFYATDGSHWLREFRFAPETGFTLEKAHEVVCGLAGPIRNLNEIEFVHPHYLFMNVWHTGYVLVYDLSKNACIRLVDVGGNVLLTGPGRGEGVMNGLAAAPDGGEGFVKLLVTGKLWADMYAVQINQL